MGMVFLFSFTFSFHHSANGQPLYKLMLDCFVFLLAHIKLCPTRWQVIHFSHWVNLPHIQRLEIYFLFRGGYTTFRTSLGGSYFVDNNFWNSVYLSMVKFVFSGWFTTFFTHKISLTLPPPHLQPRRENPMKDSMFLILINSNMLQCPNILIRLLWSNLLPLPLVFRNKRHT